MESVFSMLAPNCQNKKLRFYPIKPNSVHDTTVIRRSQRKHTPRKPQTEYYLLSSLKTPSNISLFTLLCQQETHIYIHTSSFLTDIYRADQRHPATSKPTCTYKVIFKRKYRNVITMNLEMKLWLESLAKTPAQQSYVTLCYYEHVLGALRAVRTLQGSLGYYALMLKIQQSAHHSFS